MVATCREVWRQEYSHLAKQQEQEQQQLTGFDAWRARAKQPLVHSDEFTQYIKGHDGEGAPTPATEAFSPITWWAYSSLPSMRQWALDTLSCPATSCECERLFSSTKKLITPERNSLGDDLIEASECLKGWWDVGIVKREQNVQ